MTDGKTIDLFPSAFTDLRTLIETLGHERAHVMQCSLFEFTADAIPAMEKAAYAVESSFWRYYLQFGRTGKLEKFR